MTMTLEFRNNSGCGDRMDVYDIGAQLSTGRQGWAEAGLAGASA
ncbi:hypothetical protein [Streptomyces sp. NBC_00280]